MKITRMRVLALLFCLFPLMAFSQKAFKKMYKSQLEPGSKLIKADYQYTIEKLKSGAVVYKQYFPETKQITHFITYSSYKKKIKEGKYVEWYDDGTEWMSGTFKNGVKDGLWKFNQNSRLEEGYYKADKREGTWTKKDSSGLTVATYNYKNNKLEGEYLIFDTKNGRVKQIDIYLNGELIESTAKDSTDKEVFKVVETLPSFPGCEDFIPTDSMSYNDCASRKMLRYIYSNIKYPRKARQYNIQGRALVSFVVDKTGEITDIDVKRGLCEDIRKECIAIVQKMPKWHPGKQNNEPVKVYFNLPIMFRLE